MGTFGPTTKASRTVKFGAVSTQPIPPEQSVFFRESGTSSITAPPVVLPIPRETPSSVTEHIVAATAVPSTITTTATTTGLAQYDGMSVSNPTSMTITTRAIVPATTPTAVSPSTYFLMPPVVDTNPRALSADSLNLSRYSIGETGFMPQTTSGISQMRPELICCGDVKKLFADDSGIVYNKFGKLLGMKYQAKILCQNVATNIYQKCIKDETTKKFLQEHQDDLPKLFVEIRNVLTQANTNYKFLSELRGAFNVKTIPDVKYQNLNLKDYFQQKMLYSLAAFQQFSDTKILAQLMFDLRSMLETRSMYLLDTNDANRGSNDMHQTRLDLSYGDSTRFSFSVETIQAKHLYEETNFNSFLGALPQSVDDKIKLLLVMLSKELRISRGLAENTNRRLITDFFQGSADGNPFDNVFGVLGEDIFVIPRGVNSLASLILFTDGTTTVLPFEQKYVDDSQTSHVPGTSYFLDAIMNITNGRYNTHPLEVYSQRFSEVVSNANTVVNQLMGFNVEANRLANSNLFAYIIAQIKTTISFLSRNYRADASLGEVGRILTIADRRSRVLELALFRLANTDPTLKAQLFQSLLLTGLVQQNSHSFFVRLKREIGQLRNLQLVSVAEGIEPELTAANLQSYLNGLHRDIESSVLSIMANTGNKSTDTLSEDSEIFNFSDSGFITNTLRTIHLNNGFTKLFVALLVYLENYTGIAAQLGDSYLTRYNQVTPSGLSMMVFELLMAFCDKYTLVDFAIPRGVSVRALTSLDTLRLDVIADTNLNNAVFEHLATIATDVTPNVYPVPSDIDSNNTGTEAILVERETRIEDPYRDLKNSINNVKRKIDEEDKTIQNGMQILSVISDNLTMVKNQALNWFNRTPTEKELQLISSYQLNLSNMLYDKAKVDLNKPDSGFEVKTVSNTNWKILNILFRESVFHRDNLKFIAVGIPANFLSKLSDRVERNSIGVINSLNQERNLTTIKIRLYKKSQKHNYIVFNPQEFLFDVTLFNTNTYSNQIEEFDTFANVLDKIVLDEYNVQQNTSGNKRSFTLKTFKAATNWNFLNNEQKLEVFRNHMISHCLQQYLYLASSVELAETTFPVDNYTYDPFKRLSGFDLEFMHNYLRNIQQYPEAKVSILANANMTNSNITDDEMRELRFVRSMNILKQSLQTEMIMNSKKFDRVFLIPFLPNEFSLNERLTKRTSVGTLAFNYLVDSRQILGTERGRFLNEDAGNNIDFDSYFTTVEGV